MNECGQDFMAGTICSLPPGHSGAHAATCQRCGFDWADGSCTCVPDGPDCQTCGDRIPAIDSTAPYCDDHACEQIDARGYWCQLKDGHHGPCDFTEWVWPAPVAPVTEAELEEVYRSFKRTCSNCHDTIVWHAGNGGQWIGDTPPRDWVTCHGSVVGPKHTPMQ